MKIRLKDNTLLEPIRIIGENTMVTTFEFKEGLKTIKNSEIKKIQFNNGEIFEPVEKSDKPIK